MEKRENQNLINPLLFLKIVVPFAFPLVGFLLPPLYSSDSTSITETDSQNNSIQEEEEEEEEEDVIMETRVIASRKEFGAPNVVTVETLEEVPSLRGEVERLSSRISEVEERENRLQFEFSEYCDVKNSESLVEKLQIMCLGSKMECLEETVVKLMEKREDAETMRGEVKKFMINFEKITQMYERKLLDIHQQMHGFEAREVALLRKNQELEIAVRDAKEMIPKKERCISEMEELTIEQGQLMSPTQNKETLNQIDRIRAQWASYMEEMIYLAWITTCLRHELSTTNKIEEEIKQDEEEEEEEEEEAISVAVAVAPKSVSIKEESTEEEIIELPASPDHDAQNYNKMIPQVNLIEQNCMDVVMRNSGSSNSRKPKLIRKLKVWAKRKGKCKRSLNEDHF